jgi:hypothetical protein
MTETSSRADPAPRDDATVLQLASSTEVVAVPAELDIVFRTQPKQVEARHRVAYRTALVVLVLSRFNRHAAKLTNLHTVMWATRTARTRRTFSAWWNGRRFYNASTERLDPDLQITLNLAIVDGLVAPAGEGRRVQLTERGNELARLLDDEHELLAIEKKFLSALEPLSDASMERQLGEVRR